MGEDTVNDMLVLGPVFNVLGGFDSVMGLMYRWFRKDREIDH
mgnify:CR=1 FL=1